MAPAVKRLDAHRIKGTQADLYISNPPWTRALMHSLILHLSAQKPTWLLFDADWAHTQQAAPYMPFCHTIISVGRLRWIPGSRHDGKDNCSWYLFDQNRPNAGTLFIGRGGASTRSESERKAA